VKDVNTLISELSDKNPNIRVGAAEALGKSDDKRAIEHLIKAMKDENMMVRRNAADALVELGDLRAVEPLIKALQDRELSVRTHAAANLGKVFDKRAIKPLVDSLQDKDWSVRKNAAESLGKIGDNIAVEPLIQALQDKEWYGYVSISAAEALGKIGDKRAAVPLIKMLQDGDADVIVRMCAITALGELGDEKALKPIIEALQDKDSKVRLSALEALEKFDDERATAPLLEAQQDNDFKVRQNATELLGKISKKSEKAVQNGKIQIMLSIFGTLCVLGEAENAAAIILALENTEPQVRMHAAEILGDCGIRQSVAVLVKRLVIEHDSRVRQAIDNALKKLRICSLKIVVDPPSEMRVGERKDVPVTMLNQGDTKVKDVRLFVRGAVEGVEKRVDSLKPTEHETFNIGLKPLESGHVPITLEFKYQDEQGNEKNETVQSFLQVKPANEGNSSDDFTMNETKGTKVIDNDAAAKTDVGRQEKPLFNICPYCGKELQLPKIPNYCPYCREKLVI